MKGHTAALEEMEKALDREERGRADDNKRLADKTEEATRLQFALHNAEQEVVKLQSVAQVFESAKLHPLAEAVRRISPEDAAKKLSDEWSFSDEVRFWT